MPGRARVARQSLSRRRSAVPAILVALIARLRGRRWLLVLAAHGRQWRDVASHLQHGLLRLAEVGLRLGLVELRVSVGAALRLFLGRSRLHVLV